MYTVVGKALLLPFCNIGNCTVWEIYFILLILCCPALMDRDYTPSGLLILATIAILSFHIHTILYSRQSRYLPYSSQSSKTSAPNNPFQKPAGV